MHISGVNGPVVRVSCVRGAFFVGEQVKAGKSGLAGEVISIRREPSEAVVQVYEDVSGLRVDEAVLGMGTPLTVRIAPGLAGGVFDGIGRRLDGGNAEEGMRKWRVRILTAAGDTALPGHPFAEVRETSAITFRALFPPDVDSTDATVVFCVPDGEYTTDAPLVTLKNGASFSIAHDRPVRMPFPVRRRLPPAQMLATGVRVIDSLFPIAKGGAAALPGGFGTGKTMLQHQLAKGCDADLIVYIGCGERGNEMAGVLQDFACLTDPRSGRGLLARTVLVANTSDMPVAAREAGIYTGLTIAEAYRDMGCHVAVMADSTSRWAEALRELSGRLEELPAEEGYPAYLTARMAAVYERAGLVETLSGAHGSITLVGAVSPQGADFSEPVTVNTKRFVRCFWALERRLAYARHFPAIDALASYSGYAEDLFDPQHAALRAHFLQILRDDAQIRQIAKILGTQELSDEQRRTLAAAEQIREAFLKQNFLDPADAFMPLHEQREMMTRLL